MNIKSIIIVLSALLTATGCSAQNKQEVKSSNNKTMNKSIVIFFSHAGDNYAVGNIEVGNTKIVADYISEIIQPEETRERIARSLEFLSQKTQNVAPAKKHGNIPL